MRETKILQFQIKATGITTNAAGQEVGQIEAYGAVFNNVDEGNDTILPKSFDRTIKNSKTRAKSRNNRYLVKMLWQHDANEIIGGWYDLIEDSFGLLGKGDILLATQRGREYYELAKAGMCDELSIIYDVPQGGATYNKSGVRELSELRLFSIDPVTFAMNDETRVVGVKSITGSTSLPIGPRNEAWDSGKAEKQIWSYATKTDGTLDAGKLRKCFMVQEGDPQKKGSWSYPYVYIKNGNPTICVGAVIAIAAAIQGARGANAPDGLKPKVALLYGKINKLYPNDPQLTPPWEDDGGKATRRRMNRKDFNDEYRTRRIEDWQSSFWTWFCALKASIMDAFDQGDDPIGDVQANLNGVDDSPGAIAELLALVQQGIDLDYSNYLDMQQQQSGYGYMARPADGLQSKVGAAISAANQEKIDAHVKAMKKLATQFKTAMHNEADDFASIMQGAEPTYAAPNEGTPDEQEGKAASYLGTRRTSKHSSQSGDTVEDDANLSSALATLRTLTL